MCEELQVNIGTRTAWSARFAPSALRRAALRVSLPLILALLAGLGLIVSVPACAAEPSLETPVPENIPGAPPPASHVLPGLTLSGYVTAQFLVPDARSGSQLALNSAMADDEPQSGRRPRLNLSHLSAIAWWEPSPAWKALGEIDLQDLVQVPAHSSEDGRASEPYVALDRLYLDYRAADSISVRAGKFLTPIGHWNQEHSDPQVWTVLRPLISQSAFPTNATGLMLFGSIPVGSQWVDYQTYASDGGEWRPSPRSHPFESAFGGRISTALNPFVQVGLSASRFQQEGLGSRRFNLFGADVAFNWHNSEFSAEIIQRRGTDANVGEEHGWFAQAAVPVVSRWWGVARIEEYRRAVDSSETNTALVGVVYRSGRHWVFKAEWARASGGAYGLPSGFLSSLTLAY